MMEIAIELNLLMGIASMDIFAINYLTSIATMDIGESIGKADVMLGVPSNKLK